VDSFFQKWLLPSHSNVLFPTSSLIPPRQHTRYLIENNTNPTS
jgi:hypothetical protein